jgi:hypothetical protein
MKDYQQKGLWAISQTIESARNGQNIRKQTKPLRFKSDT